MIELSVNIVLLGSNRNRISSRGRRRGRHNCLRRAGAQIGALVGKVTSLPTTTTEATVLSSFSPLNTFIPNSRGLEIVGALIHLTLWGGKSLSNCL
jgi:hypothetical protein